MENMNNVVREQVDFQNDEIRFEYPESSLSKPLFELEKGDVSFAVFGLFSSIFAAVFGIFGGFALGYLISSVFMLMTVGIYLSRKGRIRFYAIICGIVALANAGVFITTTNVGVRFFAVVISFLLALVCYNGFTSEKIVGDRATIGIFYSAASTVGNVVLAVRSVFSKRGDNTKSFGKIMLGLACAIPVLIIVVPLLLSSDVAFSGMMKNIFGNSEDAIIVMFKALFGANISLLVIAYGFSLKAERFEKMKESKFKGIENVFVISFLSAISICYLLYLFSQLAYFFSAFKGFLPDENITYAEYARQGFFEMCKIAIINLIIVLCSVFLSKKQNGKICAGTKLLATFVAIFTLIIIATAISKMVLYIENYGMTIKRVSTSAFMLFLAIMFIAVILRIYIVKINILKTALLSAGIVVLLLGTVNINAVCAKYNYDAYKTGKLHAIDVQAMYDLGDEGIPYVTYLACSADRDVAFEAQRYLKKAYKYDYFYDTYTTTEFSVENFKKHQKDKGFERFSIPKKKAYDCLYKFIEKNPNFHVWNGINNEL